MSVKAIPEGHSSIAPRLVVRDPVQALEFYARAFGATDSVRQADSSGRTHYAQFRIGHALVMLAEQGEGPGWSNLSPDQIGGSPVMVHIYVPDVDALASNAVAAGAKLVRPIKDEDRGDRVCTVLDPFGHRWMVATRQRDVSLDVQRQRAPEWKIQETEKSPARTAPEERLAVPYLAVHAGRKAIEFYKHAFGAAETLRFEDDSGRIGHCTLTIGDSLLFLSDEFAGICSSPRTLGGTSVLLHLYTEDVDEVAAGAVAAGAKVLIPVKDQFYGDRAGRLEDPYGHIWAIATHREDVSAEEMRLRGEAWAAQQRATRQ